MSECKPRTSMPFTPFLVTGGECRRILDDIDRENKDAFEARAAFAKKYGCGRYFADSIMRGLYCEGEIPEGWMHRKKDHPNRIVPRRKAIREVLVALPKMHDGWTFGQRINTPLIPDGNTLRWPYIETVGELVLSPEGETILWIPTAAVTAGYQPPEGAVPMKMSEYWALKEQAEGGSA